jgi:hypothetical protein
MWPPAGQRVERCLDLSRNWGVLRTDAWGCRSPGWPPSAAPVRLSHHVPPGTRVRSPAGGRRTANGLMNMDMEIKMNMKMNQAPLRLSLRTAATTPSGTMNALLRAGLGGVLLALTTACSGDMDAGSLGFDGELEDQGSELVDESDPADAPDPAGTIEKATFNTNTFFNGFDVTCTPGQQALINAAEERAGEILAIAGPANADARVNRTRGKAFIFQTSFVPNGNTNPNPNRLLPDEWDTASFSVAQKSVHLGEFLASAAHTCHGDNEPLGLFNGVLQTCGELQASAATGGLSGELNVIRWCDAGLEDDVNGRAVTLLHELNHQDRTNDATGRHVGDDASNGPVYDAQNYDRWFNNNTP